MRAVTHVLDFAGDLVERQSTGMSVVVKLSVNEISAACDPPMHDWKTVTLEGV